MPRLLLGHGASGTAASMAPWVEALAATGIAAEALDLPRGRAERAVPVFRAAIAAVAPDPVVPGGHSFGGRVASLAAAAALADDEPLAAVVLLSYPLHRPGHPETWTARTAHWPALRCPVLVLSGEADPFARPALLREAVARLPAGTLVTYPQLGHGLLAVREDVVGRIAAFVRDLA
ncbi:MAG TPA: alpha/beta family hydrolase [Candidatus Limnocylindrales bacterium]